MEQGRHANAVSRLYRKSNGTRQVANMKLGRWTKLERMFKRQPKRTTEENLAIHDKIVAARKEAAERKANIVIKDFNR